jgi:hypothetical protein
MPSARTSVGNKEYEYKGKKKRATKSQRGAGRLVAGVFGDAADVGALRHEATIKWFCHACQQLAVKLFFLGTDRTRSDVWTSNCSRCPERPFDIQRKNASLTKA